jgi:hypothetical protein
MVWESTVEFSVKPSAFSLKRFLKSSSLKNGNFFLQIQIKIYKFDTIFDMSVKNPYVAFSARLA